MKIAVCFYGKTSGFQTRYQHPSIVEKRLKRKKVMFLRGLDSIKENVFQDHEVDVYIHAWSEDIQQSESFFKKFLNPKHMIVENERNHDEHERYRHNAYLSHFFSRVSSVKAACESDVEYDIVVALRYDAYFFKPVPYHLCHPEKLYIDGDKYTRDWHICGSKKTMSKITGLVEYTREAYRKISNGKENKSMMRSTGKFYFPFYQSQGLQTKQLLRFDHKAINAPERTNYCLVRSLSINKIEELEKKYEERVASLARSTIE